MPTDDRSHCKRFWEQWRPGKSLYRHTCEALTVAEDHDEEETFWTLLAETLPTLTVQRQDDVLCALADTEATIPEHMQDTVVPLLGSTDAKVAMAAASCLLSCAGRIGRLRTMSVLVTAILPHAAHIKQILHLREHKTIGDTEE